jgi:hypothetical protein
MEQLTQHLEQYFQTASFSAMIDHQKVHFTIDDFFIRKEGNGDLILYIKPSLLPDGLKARKIIERIVDRELHKYHFEQVIVPYITFWEMLHESIQSAIASEFDEEVNSFLYKKFKNRVFRLSEGAAFTIHPYKVVNRKLVFDVRNFRDNAGGTDYIPFRRLIEEKVESAVSYIGIKSCELVVGQPASAILSEQRELMENVDGKIFKNYFTPVGVLNFTLCEPEHEFGHLKYSVKDFHLQNEHGETYQVDERSQPYLERIVRDEVLPLGFKNCSFGGQANTSIK